MIRNTDGTPYKPSGCFSMYDAGNAKHELFNRWSEESIKIGGSPILYYECLIQPQSIDPVYWEDRSKIYAPPIELYALYEPITSQYYQNMFGIDSPDVNILFELNLQAVLRDLGHLPKVGSRIFTPHRSENWEIDQIGFDQFQHWGQQILKLICSRFQESLTTGEGKVTQNTSSLPPGNPSFPQQ